MGRARADDRAALRIAPPGIHVAPPELVWQAAQEPAAEVARRWLG